MSNIAINGDCSQRVSALIYKRKHIPVVKYERIKNPYISTASDQPLDGFQCRSRKRNSVVKSCHPLVVFQIDPDLLSEEKSDNFKSLW